MALELQMHSMRILSNRMWERLNCPPAINDGKSSRLRHAVTGANRTHALIETLHTVQECFGYLDENALRFVASVLRVPLSRVYGAATFYHFFTLKPKGRHACVVCTGTACYIKGAPLLLKAIEQRYSIKPGET